MSPGAGRPGGAADPGAPRVAGVVLAAGGGSRFDGDTHKLLTPFRGRPLVAWAVEAAAGAGLDGVVVVAGAADLAAVVAGAGPGVSLVVNPAWREGQASSLQAAIAWCAEQGADAAVIGLGDQPLVGAAAWRAVARADHAPILTATFGGRRRPPVRLARSVWPLLGTRGDEGARELMRRRDDLVGEVACVGDPADVDTVDDVRRFEGLQARAGAPAVHEP